MNRKGIILAGGLGTRLFPITKAISKQLIPIYDKPMIYYALTTLMLSGVREVLIITTPKDKNGFIDLLGNGSQWGVEINYIEQKSPRGLADAYIIGKDFVANKPSILILGDNIFYGDQLRHHLNEAHKKKGATIFAYHVNNPHDYGVVEMDKNNHAISIDEKPLKPKSNYAVTGLYFYDENASYFAKELKPSLRNELEITDLNNCYLKNKTLNVEVMGRGFAWLDTGSHSSLLEASQFIEIIERRQGLKIACPEEIAWRMKFISDKQLIEQAENIKIQSYKDYLLNLLNE